MVRAGLGPRPAAVAATDEAEGGVAAGLVVVADALEQRLHHVRKQVTHDLGGLARVDQEVGEAPQRALARRVGVAAQGVDVALDVAQQVLRVVEPAAGRHSHRDVHGIRPSLGAGERTRSNATAPCPWRPLRAPRPAGQRPQGGRRRCPWPALLAFSPSLSACPVSCPASGSPARWLPACPSPRLAASAASKSPADGPHRRPASRPTHRRRTPCAGAVCTGAWPAPHFQTPRLQRLRQPQFSSPLATLPMSQAGEGAGAEHDQVLSGQGSARDGSGQPHGGELVESLPFSPRRAPARGRGALGPRERAPSAAIHLPEGSLCAEASRECAR